ncbi:MAG TPA: ribosome recycling factor [Planctomycetes bacterium]|jgi:ribosome recycling factor|nr:ribosome recycling factor [Planctomycetota bacterium]
MALSYQSFLDVATERMDKSVDLFAHDIRGIRTGRANTGLIENIRVDYYGSPTPLSQIGNISVLEARTLFVKPFDPSTASAIEKAISSADLGLSAVADGGGVRVSVPHLSEDQRNKMVSRLKTMSEDAKVAMRNIRRDFIKDVETSEKDKDSDVNLTEDDVKSAKSNIQDLLKKHESRLEELLKEKSADILEN